MATKMARLQVVGEWTERVGCAVWLRWRLPGALILALGVALGTVGCGVGPEVGAGAGSGPSVEVGAVGAGLGQVVGSVADRAVASMQFTRPGGDPVEVSVGPSGAFAAWLVPGAWSVRGREVGGALRLTTATVTVEAGMTVTVLDATLVPRPVLVSVQVPVVGHDSAVITWVTDIPADGRVDYGFDAAYGTSLSADDRLTTEHRLQLNNLMPGTTYHFRVVSSRHRLESIETRSTNLTFNTRSAP